MKEETDTINKAQLTPRSPADPRWKSPEWGSSCSADYEVWVDHLTTLSAASPATHITRKDCFFLPLLPSALVIG